MDFLKREPGIGPFTARVLLSVLFMTSSYSKAFGWQGNLQYMATRHVPAAPFFLACALAIEWLGWIFLLTGYQARIAAFVMFLYVGAVTVIYHNFWAFSGMVRATNWVHFEKNLGIMGGLLMIASFGPGKCAIGAKKTFAGR